MGPATGEDLRDMMNLLRKYLMKIKLKLNVEKTEIMFVDGIKKNEREKRGKLRASRDIQLS